MSFYVIFIIMLEVEFNIYIYIYIYIGTTVSYFTNISLFFSSELAEWIPVVLIIEVLREIQRSLYVLEYYNRDLYTRS